MAAEGNDLEAGLNELLCQFEQLENEYDRTSEVATLHKALEVMQEAVDRTASGSVPAYRGICLCHLGRCQRWLSNATGDLVLLEKAIDAGRESVLDKLSGPELSNIRPLCTAELSNSLAARYVRAYKAEGANDDKDLQDALAMARVAVASVREDGSFRDDALSALANQLRELCNVFGSDCYLDEAIQIRRELLSTAPSGVRDAYSLYLALDLKKRFDRHGEIEDLMAAKTSFVEGMDALPKGHVDRSVIASAFAGCLIALAETTTEAHWLDEANGLLEEDLAIDYLCKGLCLQTKYSLFGGVPNLTASMDALRSAVRLLPEDDADKPKYLHSLAMALGDYFDHTGQVESLNEAIQLDREAASKLEDSHSDASFVFHGLSCHLSSRNALTGNLHDLAEAESASEAAVARAVVDSGQRCICLQRLSNVLQDRYQAEGNIEYLERAIVVILEALSTNGGDLHIEVLCESAYANAVSARYDAYGDEHDLDLAIVTERNIVAKTPKSSRLRMTAMSNLGCSLQMKYFRAEDRDEKLRALQEAHDLVEQCIHETGEDDYSFTPTLLRSLGIRKVLLGQFMDQSDTPLLLAQVKLSLTTLQQAYNIPYQTPLNRMVSGYRAGYFHMDFEKWNTASKILSECVHMFRHFSPISLTDNDRQRRLRELSGIASLACASYLAQGKVEQGIEILESGRGIMASIAMRIQDNYLAVKEADASLHARYIRTRQALSQPLLDSSSHIQDVVAERTAAMKEFEEIENIIRAIPGHERFNKGLSSKEMRALAVCGPLVAFCTVDQRCDALIVTTEAIKALPLPALNNKEIQKQVQLVVGASRLSMAMPTKHATANKRMRALLSWLWDAVVSPVLEHLALTQGPANKPRPRLWWITSGQLGLLPLHAAGKGKRQPRHNAFAHVISSYISSFEALAFARERQSRLDITSPRMAVVTMPQTPGRLADLDTDKEAHAICEVFRSIYTSFQSAELLELRQRSVEEVVQHLQSIAVDIFHFACHAEPDMKDPSKTSLLLGSDPTAPSPDLLPIRELRKFYGSSSGRPPRLAYLSACCTAQQYELRLIDESIHLAGAFQLLGFPAVVGTLWEADDSAAVVIARAFYQELFRLDESTRHGTGQPLPGDIVARALDFAVSTYREQKIGRVSIEEEILLWANYVHIGA